MNLYLPSLSRILLKNAVLRSSTRVWPADGRTHPPTEMRGRIWKWSQLPSDGQISSSFLLPDAFLDKEVGGDSVGEGSDSQKDLPRIAATKEWSVETVWNERTVIINLLPISEWVSGASGRISAGERMIAASSAEQANKWAVRANERMD